jgi:hypothetical protein
MAVLLGEFNVGGMPIQHLGYFDVLPGEPTIIEIVGKWCRQSHCAVRATRLDCGRVTAAWKAETIGR